MPIPHYIYCFFVIAAFEKEAFWEVDAHFVTCKSQGNRAATCGAIAPEYDLPTIEEAITKLAQENKQYDAGGELIVPHRIIIFLEKKYQSNKSMSELCQIYINEYLA